MIQPERIKALNPLGIKKGDYVLYWMQAAQRAEGNQALDYAVVRANELNMPLVVFFGITDKFPEANVRHYTFMLEGLQEVQRDLEKRGILMVIQHISPPEGAVQMAKKAALVVVDGGYLRIQKQWRAQAAGGMDCSLLQVETEVIVPVQEASTKEEYTAATFRPKIKDKLPYYLRPLQEQEPHLTSLSLNFPSFPLDRIDKAISRLKIDDSVKGVAGLRGGLREARRRLQVFIEKKLAHYAQRRNDPTVDYLSHLSPYLHFGQISPLEVALKVKEVGGPGADAFLEELIVRRELSMNFVFYNDHYDSFLGLPAWARKTLEDHKRDVRPYVYGVEELEEARTHDPYWNAAQREMVITGKMHGYMRMYWGKKILEWCPDPAEALRIALYLNNKYELDGRDPNGFAGVAWCFGKHDRPWARRPVFGTVRYMNAQGLRRKFDADGYVRRIDSLVRGRCDDI